MKLNKTTAVQVIAQAIADKSAKSEIKVFINTFKPVSIDTIMCLLNQVNTGRDTLIHACRDKKGFWYFQTV